MVPLHGTASYGLCATRVGGDRVVRLTCDTPFWNHCQRGARGVPANLAGSSAHTDAGGWRIAALVCE